MRLINPLLLFTTLLASSTTVLGRSAPQPKTPEISHLFVDFDGTIAVNEAFETLCLAAYASTKDQTKYPPWSYFQEIYFEEYENFTSVYPARTTIRKEITFRSHPTLHKVESASYSRVAASRIFSNTKFSVLQSFARDVQVRAGWWEFVAAALDAGVQPKVVSLNWSVVWLRLVMREHLEKYIKELGPKEARKRGIDRGLVERVAIYCAEIVPRGVVKANKYDYPVRLHTGGDKVQLIKKLIGTKGGKGGKKNGGKIVFIGDSKSDLPPLVDSADVGIVAGTDITSALEGWGVKVRQMGVGYYGESGEKMLYRLDDFREVVKAGLFKKGRKSVLEGKPYTVHAEL